MTVSSQGELIVLVESGTTCDMAQWYDRQGKLLHSLKYPDSCTSTHISCYVTSILGVVLGGKDLLAFSCSQCQRIVVGTRGAGPYSVSWHALGPEKSKQCQPGEAQNKVLRMVNGPWSVAWEPKWEVNSGERKDQPIPGIMCHGKPGQIIATNNQGSGDSVCVFDITQIPFHLIEPEMKVGMVPSDICYCNLSGVGGAVAVASTSRDYMLSMYDMQSSALLWSIGRDKMNAGIPWVPDALCTDNRGRLYVASTNNHIIAVLSAASGSELQFLQGRGHRQEVGRDHRGFKEHRYFVDPGVTVVQAAIRYEDDMPCWDQVDSSSVLFEQKRLGRPRKICWDEQAKSIILFQEDNTILYCQPDV